MFREDREIVPVKEDRARKNLEIYDYAIGEAVRSEKSWQSLKSFYYTRVYLLILFYEFLKSCYTTFSFYYRISRD